MATPPTARIRGDQYRIIATQHPPISIFEKHVPAAMLDALYALEAETNPRLLQEAGDLKLVMPDDRVSGPGASIVMASFTHIGRATRFSDGSYGVYYAGRKIETAVRETVHHRNIIAQDARLSPTEFSMRVWIGTVQKALHDIRGEGYEHLHDSAPRPEQHPEAQAFGKIMRQQESWGLLYRSVHHNGGECVAAFRPPAVSLPMQGRHLVYVWNGEKIAEVYERSETLYSF